MSTRWTQNRDVACRVIEGTAVLIVSETAEIKGLNRAGTRIWKFLETPHDLEEVVEDLCREFEVEPARARADAEAFLAQMTAKGLVREAP